MIHLFKEEFSEIYQFLKRNGNETVIIVTATLFIVLQDYHTIGNEWLSDFLFYGVCPILVILFILRKNPLDFGLRSGNPRTWWFYVGVLCLVAAEILYAS